MLLQNNVSAPWKLSYSNSLQICFQTDCYRRYFLPKVSPPTITLWSSCQCHVFGWVSMNPNTDVDKLQGYIKWWWAVWWRQERWDRIPGWHERAEGRTAGWEEVWRDINDNDWPRVRGVKGTNIWNTMRIMCGRLEVHTIIRWGVWRTKWWWLWKYLDDLQKHLFSLLEE